MKVTSILVTTVLTLGLTTAMSQAEPPPEPNFVAQHVDNNATLPTIRPILCYVFPRSDICNNK